MKKRFQRPSTSLLAVLLSAGVLAACGGGFSPVQAPVPPPARVSLIDFRAGSLQDPSAFDLVAGQRVRTDQNPEWDFLFSVTEDGDPQFRPRGEVLDVGPSSGLQRVDAEFGALTEVPEEGYVREERIAVEEGAVYAAVSRPRAGTRCRLFGKLEVVSLDLEAGEVTFDFVVNPNCNNRDVQPDAFGPDDS